jgi:hypothetical protein
MTRLTIVAIAVAAGLALAAGPARAQQGEPPYPHGAFKEDCTLCHTGDSWRPAVVSKAFKHPASYPLRGAHATAACRDCHLSLDFAKAPTACADCHRDPHRGELGADCAMCHTPRNFLDRSAQLDQHRKTRFPLTGAHITQDCEGCHKPEPQGHLVYVNTPIECQACHLPLYLATTDPNHAAAGFPQDCSFCHTTTVWTTARFDHRNTAFPLTGAHVGLDCRSCHANGYAGTPTACYACHKTDYDNTTDPNHGSAGFPTDCTLCHNTTSFQDATFDHSTTAFPLTGSHVGVACASCHSAGYTNTPTACFACHATDYNNTNDPNHAAAGFSTDCTPCHNTTSFQGAKFTQHDPLYFPIYSGRHNNTWNSCADCHTVATNFASFSCFLCHAQGTTDSHHQGVNGYSYDSNACYSCHPRGSAG